MSGNKVQLRTKTPLPTILYYFSPHGTITTKTYCAIHRPVADTSKHPPQCAAQTHNSTTHETTCHVHCARPPPTVLIIFTVMTAAHACYTTTNPTRLAVQHGTAHPAPCTAVRWPTAVSSANLGHGSVSRLGGSPHFFFLFLFIYF